MFQVATFWDPGVLVSGRKLPGSLMTWSRKMESKMFPSPCLSRNLLSKQKKTTSKASQLKLPGWPDQVKVNLQSPLLFVLPARLLCTLLMPNGSRVTEIYPSNSTSGPMSWDGSSNILLLSSEPDSFSGRKDIQPMLPRKKLKKKCTLTKNSTGGSTKNSWLSPLSKESKQNLRNLQELI